MNGTNYAPCNIHKGDGEVTLTLEMPGVSKDNLNVKIDGDNLIIHGTKKLDLPEGNFRLKEIRDADYHHEFILDETIDRNKVEAVMEKGILSLTLHLKESEKPRVIKVNSR